MDVSDEAPAYGTTPFPTDALRQGPKLGRLRNVEGFVGVDTNADLLASHLAELDGFGLRPTVEFFIQGAIDPTTVPARTSALTDAVFVLEVDPATAESGAPIVFDWKYDADRGVIAGSPANGTYLREGTRYAAVLTTDVKNVEGDSVFTSIDVGVLGDDPPKRWQTSGEAYKELIRFPDVKDRIAGLAVFTTQDASSVLANARNVIVNTAAIAAPTLTFDNPAHIFDTPNKLDALLGVATKDTTGPRAGLEQWGSDNPTGIAHEHIAVIATGKTTIAQFVRPDTGTDGPEDETFQLSVGIPQLAIKDPISIPITVILPRGAMPANGFPVVVYSHDLGGSRHDVLALAEPLTAQGYAVVAIDMWAHGSRYSPTDAANNLAKQGFTGDATLQDGFGDDVGRAAYFEFFESFQNFSAVRDAIRQSTLDVSRVAILLRNKPSLAALTSALGFTPKLDGDRIAFLGEGFGSIIGTDLAAIEPAIGLYVLDVPGGGLVDYILPHSAAIGDLALPFVEAIYRPSGTLDRFHPLVGALQAIFDGADSLTFARHVLRDRLTVENNILGKRHIVCLEVMHDEEMPNVATEALARSFGLHTLRPNIAPPTGLLQVESPASNNLNAQTAVLVQYEPATHGNNWSARQGTLEYQPGYPQPGYDRFPALDRAITINEPLYETHAQLAEILSTYFSGLAPRVRSTKPPVADFDGDGKLDNIDPDPYDPNK
jgi:fermentation-respiration switch protein FrsA (DUF1100 family)